MNDKAGPDEVDADGRKSIRGHDEIGVHGVDGTHVGIYGEPSNHTVAAVTLANREYGLQIVKSAAADGVECFLCGHAVM